MLSEIKDIPKKAKEFLANTPDFKLPTGVPYLGMGSSYFAPLAFKYMGVNIFPELASEFFNYLHKGNKATNGVLLSQSGRSTEVLWAAELFESFTAITNKLDSPLTQFSGAATIIDLFAGEEKYSSSKTYVNTLLALFKGFGMDAGHAVNILSTNTNKYEQQGKEIANTIFSLIQQNKLNGLYITGSGPNIATALQAALIMSESTKLNFNGLAMAQYDHGPKETAKNSVVINIAAKGKSYERTSKLTEAIQNAGATVFTIVEPAVSENESVINNIIPFNYMAYYLSELLEIKDTFIVGGKVTEVK